MVGLGAPFLSAVPLVRTPSSARRMIANRPPGPSRSGSAPMLGQFTWPVTGGFPVTPPEETAGGVELRCYKCGLNPPMLMQPAAAALNPACTEVDASQCAAQQEEIEEAITEGGPVIGPTPLPGTTPGGAGTTQTEAALTVFEPEELGPMENADVRVLQVNPWDGSTREVATGTTDAQGKYYLSQALSKYPSPTGMGSLAGDLRFIVTSGVGAPAFPEVQTAVRAMGAETPPSFVVACPAGTSSLTCEVARAQAMWATTYEQQLLAWHYESSGRPPQVAALAADWAHSAVENGLVPQDPRLAGRWIAGYSWWIGDLGIPPKDWDDLLDWSGQAFQLFAAIPFPEWPGLKDYFVRCARAIPITQGQDGENFGVGNPRLYSKTYSDYFPTTDEKIERDMAVAYSDGFAAILRCIVHKIKQKTKEIERSAKAMSMISMGVIVAFAPMLIAAGPAGFSVIATEAYEFVKFQKEGTGIETYGVTAALAAAALAAGNIDFVLAALEPAIGEALAELDPVARSAVQAAYPQIINAAVDAVLGPQGIGSGFESGGGAVGGAAVAMAIKMIAGIAKQYAANRIEEFGDVLVGGQQAVNDINAVMNGQQASPYLRPFIIWVAEKTGLIEIVEAGIDQFLDELLEAFEAGQAQGGSVAVVPEEGGGGPAIVPTNAEGIPTDLEGNPLPGGMAPLTEPKDPTKPSTGEVVGAVGAGGAAVMLLAVATGLV